MDKGRFLIETHLGTGKPIAELARAHGVNRGGLYELLARYRRGESAGLEPRSRRPHRSSSRIAHRWEDEIVALGSELVDFGADPGAENIAVSRKTVHRHLTAVSRSRRSICG